jgi:hypothetical protein
VGLARGGLERGARTALLLLILAPAAFLFAWGVSEFGGYALGHAPFVAVLAAQAFPRRAARALLIAAPLLFVQALPSLRDLRMGQERFDVNARARLVGEHLQGATFLATVDNAPSITIYLPGAVELNAGEAMGRGVELGLSPPAIAEALLESARAELARTGRLVVDLGFDTQRERAPIALRLPVLDPLVAALRAEFRTTTVEDPSWPLLIVER